MAVAELKRLLAQHKAEGGPDEESPQVWCVFDRDDHSAVDEAISKAIRIAEIEGRFRQARHRGVDADARHRRDGREAPTQRVPSSNAWELVEALGTAY